MKSLPKMGLHLSLCAIPLCFANLAHAASSTTLSLGGYFTQSAAIIDVDETGNLNLEDESLDQNGEIHFKGKSVLENGTEIGLRVELEASSHGDQIDEHYLYLVADWGKLIIGAENGVAYLGHVGHNDLSPDCRAMIMSLLTIYISTHSIRLLAMTR